MIESIGDLFSRFARRFMPHPFVFALLLTVLTFLLGLSVGRQTPLALAAHWAEGVFTPALLTFMVQMCLILVTGHALASTRPMASLLRTIAGIPRGPRSAVAITSVVTMAVALVNWGLALIVGALLAREVMTRARDRGTALHYPLVVAAGFTGLIIWHGGFSGSAPLTVATPGHFLEKEMGVLPITATILAPMNIVLRLALLAAVPVFLALMVPKRLLTGPTDPRGTTPRREGDLRAQPATGVADSMVASGARAAEAPATDAAAGDAPAARLERSRVLVLLVAGLGAVYLVSRFSSQGLAALELNTLILVFLVIGIVLHGTPARYAAAIDDAAPGVSGILLQFPLYFGIMGMTRGAGLTEPLAQIFVRISELCAGAGVSPGASFGVTTFLAATIVNVLVPSGGGQWAVQGPIAIHAAADLGVPFERAVLAIAYGDECSNMLQPFWALPLLAITGLSARDIFGYTALLMLLVAPIFLACLVLF